MSRYTPRNGCGRKLQFATEADARTAPNTRPYPCGVCFYWHVTQMTEAEFAAQRRSPTGRDPTTYLPSFHNLPRDPNAPLSSGPMQRYRKG